MSRWDEFLAGQDKQVFAAAGYGARAGFGHRPVVTVIDVKYASCGDKPEPILQSVKRWRNWCGEAPWEAVGAIQRLLPAPSGFRSSAPRGPAPARTDPTGAAGWTRIPCGYEDVDSDV